LARNVAFIAATMEAGVYFVACDQPFAPGLTLHIMESIPEYLQQAEQCERQAAEASLPSSRESLLNTAVIWRKLAASAQAVGEARLQPHPKRNSNLQTG
jgi:hypothetical protein